MNKHYQESLNRYTIYSFTVTICAFLFVSFVKEVVSNHYLFNFSIDLIVGSIGLVLTVTNMMNIFKLLRKTKVEMTPFIVETVTILVALAMAVITSTSPFDVSFLILVIGMIAGKKNFEKELS